MLNNSSNMNQEELLSDFLATEKQLVKEYAGDVTESSCPNLRRILINNMIECAADQLCVFEEMKSRNMYQTKDAPDQEVTEAKNKMQQLRQQTGI